MSNMAEAAEAKAENLQENQKENTQKQEENAAKNEDNAVTQPEGTVVVESKEDPSSKPEPEDNKAEEKSKSQAVVSTEDMLTPEQRRERTIRIVDEILARKNSEASHVHHKTIEARGMFRKQRDIARDLKHMRDDFLNMEVEVNDMKRQMMLRRHAPSSAWRADKFIYNHPHLKYSLADFTLK